MDRHAPFASEDGLRTTVTVISKRDAWYCMQYLINLSVINYTLYSIVHHSEAVGECLCGPCDEYPRRLSPNPIPWAAEKGKKKKTVMLIAKRTTNFFQKHTKLRNRPT